VETYNSPSSREAHSSFVSQATIVDPSDSVTTLSLVG
jgi:hypothetical protein